MPCGGQWACFGLAVTNDAGHDEFWVVEHRTKRVTQRVAQFAAFMNRSWTLRRYVARYAPRE